MSKKKKILIEEHFKGVSENLFSQIKMKKLGEGIDQARKFTLKNAGGGWTKPTEKRATITLYDSINRMGAPEVVIKTSRGNTYEMTLLELADIRDICNHFKDLGQNVFTETRIAGEE